MNEEFNKIVDKTTDFSGSKSRKTAKGILGVIIILLLGALGLEATNNDFDLGKIIGGSTISESKVLRDKQGNIVTDKALGKGEDEYNCDDFMTQKEAQTFFDNAGGVSGDVNRLDGNKDGEACESLPKGQ